MTKLLNWFYKTRLGEFWLEKKLLKKNKELVEEIENITGSKSLYPIFQDTNQHKYQEGIHNLKHKINKEVQDNKSSYEEVLKNKELVTLAREETNQERQLRELKEKIYVRKDADLQSELDKYEMIQKRIDDFYSLQKYNEEKEVLRQIRLAHRAGNKDLAERLKNEWQQRFKHTSS